MRGFRSNASIANLKAEAQEPFRFFKLYASAASARARSSGS